MLVNKNILNETRNLVSTQWGSWRNIDANGIESLTQQPEKNLEPGPIPQAIWSIHVTLSLP